MSRAVTNERAPLQAFEDNFDDFYETGKTFINNLAIADANERSDYRFSVTTFNQEGILPNSEFDRITVNLGAGLKHTKWLNTRFGVQYIRSEVNGTGAAGANDQNILGWTTFTPTTDFNSFRPWIDESGNQINVPNNTTNNPFWIRNENINRRDDDRFIANMTQVITPIENLNITSRLGYDYEYDERLITNRVGTITALTGTYDVDVILRKQFNWDAIVDYTKTIGDIYDQRFGRI